MGNVTYCMQILLPDPSPAHLYINLSWLIGSAGTVSNACFISDSFGEGIQP